MNLHTRIRRHMAAALAASWLLIGGCGSLSPTGQRQPAAAPPHRAPVEAAAAAPAALRPISVFGEFGPMMRRSESPMVEAGIQQHTACEDGDDADVALDPTGRWLAFSSTRHSERANIYLQRVDGSSVIQLTGDAADDAHPAFSPDGKRLAFCSTRAGNWDIYVMDVDGRNVEQITNSPMQELHPSFSPDGTRLVYSALSPRSGQWELWVIDLRTRESKVIGAGLFPSWSPRRDVDRIAFQRARQRGSRMFSIWTLDLVDGEPRRITEVAVSANAAVVSPKWSPDGSRLVFTTILSPSAGTGPTRQAIWTIGADGSGRQRLTDGVGINLSPFWAADNRIYFVSDRGGRENIWSVRVDGPRLTGAAAEAQPAPAANAPAAIGAAGTAELGH